VLLDLINSTGNPFESTTCIDHPYLSTSFQQALAAVYYGLEYGSRILVIHAAPGSGKTTLLRYLKRQLQHRSSTLLIAVKSENEGEVLSKLLSEIGGTPISDDPVMLREQIDKRLACSASSNGSVVLLLDYDQEGNCSILDILRHFAYLESVEKGWLRILITSGPELAEPLRVSGLVDEMIGLSPLNASEVGGYIDHRLRLAGWRDPRLLTDKAHAVIAEKSLGIPSAINEICSQLLQNLPSLTGDHDVGGQQGALDESCIELLLADKNIADNEFRTAPRFTRLLSVNPRIALLASIVVILLSAIAGAYYQSVAKKHAAKHIAPIERLPHSVSRGRSYGQLLQKHRAPKQKREASKDLMSEEDLKPTKYLLVRITESLPLALPSIQSGAYLYQVAVSFSQAERSVSRRAHELSSLVNFEEHQAQMAAAPLDSQLSRAGSNSTADCAVITEGVPTSPQHWS
jgi:MSHA biogenesis protein MshM